MDVLKSYQNPFPDTETIESCGGEAKTPHKTTNAITDKAILILPAPTSQISFSIMFISYCSAALRSVKRC